jgi:hypothetical protein
MSLYLQDGNLIRNGSSIGIGANCCCSLCTLSVDCTGAPAAIEITVPASNLSVCISGLPCEAASRFDLPETTVTLYKCTQQYDEPTSPQCRYSRWIYRNTPVQVGTIDTPCYTGGPCYSEPVYLVISIGQFCTYCPFGNPVEPPYTPTVSIGHWTADIWLVTSSNGNGKSCDSCEITPVDVSTTPCANILLPADTSNAYYGYAFTWTVSANCPSVWTPATTPPPTIGPSCDDASAAIQAFHEDWIYEPDPDEVPLTCIPYGTYFYLDFDGNVASLVVSTIP